MSHRHLITTVAALGLLVSNGPLAAETEGGVWQGFRNHEPSAELPATFGLTEIWKTELGAGYSGVTVAGDRLVTLFTAGEDDVLAAFDRATGDELWRLKLADKYAGHHGSDDGPLATPTVDGAHVFALGPKGQLVAARLKDGHEMWRVQLDESNSTVPFYGYTASPLIVNDRVIVTAGGPGRTVVAYDRASGEELWASGDDKITYQSPIVAELAGRRQIVATSDFEVRGLDPRNGAVLWTFRHSTGSEGQESVHPTVIDDEHVLLNLSSGALMLKIAGAGGSFTAEEAWRGRAFGNALVLPVLHDGTLYGFTGRILTAVDPAAGDFKWRSRDAAAVNLSLVSGHLATVTRDGHLVIAKAAPDAYHEVARRKVFEAGDYADPSFMDGTFYVRNQTHLAAVKVDVGAQNDAGPAVAQDPNRYLGHFGAFVKDVEAKPENERQGAVDTYFADTPHTPIVEADGSAHVIYRGEADEITLFGPVLGDAEDALLHHVKGTDLHYRSVKLDPKANYNYLLGIDFESPGADPANPLQEDAGFRVTSELRGADFRANPYLDEPGPDAARGTVHSFRFRSEILNNSREIKVWLPADYDPGTTYPLLVVNHGPDSLRNGLLGNTLDHLVGKTVRPVVVVLVPRQDRPEYNGEASADYARFLVEEVVPHMERHYNTGDERAVMGPASAGVVSLRAALSHPGVFDQVSVQSFYLQDDNRERYLAMIKDSEGKPRVRLETGPNDYMIPDAGIDAQRSHKLLTEHLQAKGIDFETHTVHGTASWVGWRAQFDRILEDLFPVTGE